MRRGSTGAPHLGTMTTLVAPASRPGRDSRVPTAPLRLIRRRRPTSGVWRVRAVAPSRPRARGDVAVVAIALGLVAYLTAAPLVAFARALAARPLAVAAVLCACAAVVAAVLTARAWRAHVAATTTTTTTTTRVQPAAAEPAARQLGNYELLARIDAGGMGEVWLARHTALARRAAVKFIRPELTRSGNRVDLATAQRRFEREAQTLASLRSPHTVQLYDFGRAADGTVYYAMELLDGINLEQLVRRFGAQPPARVVRILAQVCHALAEAHARGLVHRDIKPGNLQLTAQGGDYDVVKVLDFGLVKSRDGARDSLVGGERMVCGTPGYLAPEALLGQGVVDARADLYALGCVAYRLLTGRPVFTGRTRVELLRAHLEEDPTPLAAFTGRSVPPALAELVMALLARSPGARPASAAEVARRLAAVPLPREWTAADAAAWWQACAAAPTPPARQASREEASTIQAVRRRRRNSARRG